MRMRELANLAREGGEIAIDTEFVGEGRYRALLCLIQIAVRDGDGTRIEVLDPLRGDEPGELAAVLGDPEVEVVLHAGRQDIGLLRREWGTDVRNVFDTQIAAAFAGYGAQLGYAPLVQAVLKRRLHSSHGFTRWDRRPLSPEQLAYAREDVEDLLEVADRLRDRLLERGRLDWAREECRALESSREGREPEEAFERVKGAGRAKPRERAVIRELAGWRERTAQEEDKPTGTILQDPILVEIARRRPKDAKDLEKVRGVHGGILRRRGREILAAVRRGEDAPEPPAPPSGPRPAKSDQPLISLCEALVRARTQEAGLAYELVASRDELTRLVAAARAGEREPGVRALQGWRRELIGEELLRLLAGRVALSVGDGGLRVDEAGR